jgi:hypothetical protein
MELKEAGAGTVREEKEWSVRRRGREGAGEGKGQEKGRDRRREGTGEGKGQEKRRSVVGVKIGQRQGEL